MSVVSWWSALPLACPDAAQASKRGRCTAVLLAVLALVLAAEPAQATRLEQAVRMALQTNPEIGEAAANQDATRFELDQAHGARLPRLDLEGSTGVGRRNGIGNSGSRYDNGEVDLVVRQLLFDGFETRREIERRAARVDGARLRSLERSQLIALSVAREYVEMALRQRIVRLGEQHVRKLNEYRRKIEAGVAGGTVSTVDVEQARERILGAEASLAEARDQLEAARIRLHRLVGAPIVPSGQLPRLALPPSVQAAVSTALDQSPTILAARADLDASYAHYRTSHAPWLPKLEVELRGRRGYDLDGVDGRDHDARASLVASWNLFNGGIDTASRQALLRRVDEQRFRLESATRAIEEAVRISWEHKVNQLAKLGKLRAQLVKSDALVVAYAQQFEIGRRTLIDLLDTQNTRLAAQVNHETALAAVTFADYRILAATARLVAALGSMPQGAAPPAATRELHTVPAAPAAEDERRLQPRHDPYPATAAPTPPAQRDGAPQPASLGGPPPGAMPVAPPPPSPQRALERSIEHEARTRWLPGENLQGNDRP
jgi:adhesin transport system outer membrane protein